MGADPKAGDGVGMLIQIPDAFFRKVLGDTIALPHLPNVSTAVLERPVSDLGDGAIVLGTWTAPARLQRVRLAAASAGGSAALAEPFVLPEGADHAFAMAEIGRAHV